MGDLTREIIEAYVDTGEPMWVIKNCKKQQKYGRPKICCPCPKIWTEWFYLTLLHSTNVNRLPNNEAPDKKKVLFTQNTELNDLRKIICLRKFVSLTFKN